jgi:sucrose phosphorylase
MGSLGGLVSFKHNNDGTQSPYEVNINYFDALNAGIAARTRSPGRPLRQLTPSCSRSWACRRYTSMLFGSQLAGGCEADWSQPLINREA